MTDGSWVAVNAALYQTKVSVVTPTAGAFSLVAGADRRRVRLEFRDFSGSTTGPSPFPGPIPPTLSSDGNAAFPLVYLYRDAPSMVTGEWYALTMLGTTYVVIEEIYIGP